MKSYFRPEVEIRPFRACAMHRAIIIGTVRSLWTWLWGRYHVPQNAFLVLKMERATRSVSQMAPSQCSYSDGMSTAALRRGQTLAAATAAVAAVETAHKADYSFVA